MKKTLKYILLLFTLACVLAVAPFAVACDGEQTPPPEPSDVPTYTMTFVVPSGADTIPPISGKAGDTVTAVVAPVITGYRFDGWFLSAEFSGTAVALPTTIPGTNTTYYAKYTKVNTIIFVTGDNATEIAPITEEAGKTVAPPANPVKAGHTFLGWYSQPNGAGEKIDTLPTVMPEAETTTYYAHYKENFKLVFMPNDGSVDTEMLQAYADSDGNVTIPECTFVCEGARHIGWTTAADGKLAFNTVGEMTQGYGEGDTLTLAADMTLYAQWADDYWNSDESSSDVVYIARNNVESGIGAAILVRDGKPDKLGFIETDMGTNEIEFTFYLDESEGGEIRGKLYEFDRTFRYRDEMYGFYVGYDHKTDATIGEMLYADGYGRSGVFTMVGAQLSITAYGYYVYDENFNEYAFIEIDPVTGDVLTEENGQPRGFYFTVQKAEVDDVAPPAGSDTDAPLNGYFLRISDEAGDYYDYANGEMGDRLLELNGYGYARLFVSVDGTTILLCEGAYNPTNVTGEWLFTPDAKYEGIDGVSSFRFILTYAASGTQYVYLFITYDETHKDTYTAANGDTIQMDGYGGMVYTTTLGTFEGNFQYTDGEASPNLTFYAYDEDGNRVATMYFDVNWMDKTFTVNNDEFIVDANGVIIAYRGNSKIVIIPEQVGDITVTGIADNVFKAVTDDDGNLLFSVEEVTIPATVTNIGKLAFQNNYTLRRVTFLGAVPPVIDFATANDPFRWPAGGFTIVVPEDAKVAYIEAFTTAWTSAGRNPADLYRIRGSVEVTLLPEFEVDENGVLISYNRPATDDPDALKDLVLTVGQTEHGGENIKITAIAPEVFLGATWLRSIDLGGVTVIGEAAFENCTSLVSVTFDKVTDIGAAAFYGCEKLMSENEGRLNLPAIENIGASAFAWCSALKYIVTGADIESVGVNAFAFIKIDADLTAPLFFELTGANPPAMASGMTGTESRSVFAGNSAYRIVIPDIAYAVKCYNDTAWSTFNGSLYIASGDEKGTYIGGSNVLTLDGRAVLDTTFVWLYEIDGTTITFYEYVRELGTYVTFSGRIQNGVITFRYEDTDFTVAKSEGPMTFVSVDGKYTLVVAEPSKLDPDLYMGQNIDATFNDVPVKLTIKNYNYKTIAAFSVEGVLYDFTLTLENDGTFTYTTALTPLTFTAQDGSTIRIFGTTHNFANVTLATLTYRTATGDIETATNYTSDYRSVIFCENGIYAVQVQRGNDYYVVLIMTAGDSFTYHTGVYARTASLYQTTDGDCAVVYEGDGVVSGISLILQGVYTEATFVVGDTGYTVTTADAVYTVITDADGNCTITQNQ